MGGGTSEAGRFAGYRAMKLEPRGVGAPRMLSVSNVGGSPFEWIPGRDNRADCAQGKDHEEPVPLDCTCGFWSFKELGLVDEHLYRVHQGVHVLIAAWGATVEHTLGFRSEYARPIAAIWPLPERAWDGWRPERARRHVKSIGLPLVGLDELPGLIRAHELDTAAVCPPPALVQYVTADGGVGFCDQNFPPPDLGGDLLVLPYPAEHDHGRYRAEVPWGATVGFGPVNKVAHTLRRLAVVGDGGRTYLFWAPEGAISPATAAAIDAALDAPGVGTFEAGI